MAQKNRADLSDIILANIPDNSTELITPLKHREVEDDLKDSNFNILDDTAFDVNYTPLVSADWNVTIPTEVKGGLDQLASRVKTIETSLINNHSLSVFYVSKQGNDGTAQEGNELRPYATINGAITAMGANPTNKKLVVLGGGTYSENITITNATNCVFDFCSTNIVGDFSGTNLNNCYINFKGGKLTGNFTTVGTNSLYDFTGGEITGNFTATSSSFSTFLMSKISGNDIVANNAIHCYFDFNNSIYTSKAIFVFFNSSTSIIKNVYINNITTQCWLFLFLLDNVNITSSVGVRNETSYTYNSSFISNNNQNALNGGANKTNTYLNCVIKNTSNGYAIDGVSFSTFINCKIESNTNVTIYSAISNDIKNVIRLYNCDVKSTSFYNLSGQNGVSNLIAYNCKFTAGQYNIYVGGIAPNFSKWLQFKNCEFYVTGTYSNVQLTSGLIRTLDVNYQFIGCSFYTETGYAFLEPTTYDGSDAGKVIAINCLANKTALANPAPVKITEQNNYFDVNLQNFNNI